MAATREGTIALALTPKSFIEMHVIKNKTNNQLSVRAGLANAEMAPMATIRLQVDHVLKLNHMVRETIAKIAIELVNNCVALWKTFGGSVPR